VVAEAVCRCARLVRDFVQDARLQKTIECAVERHPVVLRKRPLQITLRERMAGTRKMVQHIQPAVGDAELMRFQDVLSCLFHLAKVVFCNKIANISRKVKAEPQIMGC
jgi:hypothetical protein